MTFRRLRAVGLASSIAAAALLGLPAAGLAAAPGHGVVREGNARFEVLSPTLIRLEYAADGRFEDRATFNAVDRRPRGVVRTHTEHGDVVLSTGRVTVRYRRGSGPFSAENTTVTVRGGGYAATGHPTWPSPAGRCDFGTACQAEDGRLTGGESVNYDHTGFAGRGFTADYGQASAADAWTVSGVPADGDYALQVRYANGGTAARTMSASANGADAGTVTFAPTASWDDWGVATLAVHLHAGTDVVALSCGAGDGCNVNVDEVALTRAGASLPDRTTTSPPPVDEPGQLGGWTRGLDAYANQAGTSLADIHLHPGILNRRGWSLLDDTATALRTRDGWATPRPAHRGAYQDGYLFAYGHDYQQALRDLRTLTGPADMLPQWAFGVWFSEYNAFTTSDYQNELLPAFRANRVPLDALVVDTDWKSPQQWDGWNWNPDLFPDPQGFLDWARREGLAVTLNVHAGMDGSDPKFPQAQATAHGKLQRAAQCFSPTCYRFDWSDRDQARAWFSLHTPFERQGVRQWWLDWCCTDSVVDMPGLTPDSWINERYARDLDARGLRGFALARLGASFEDYRGAPAAGPWGEHRSTVHFTGDSEPTWDTLALEARLTAAEGAIGEPYVSHDIGSFKGKHLPDDLYARWVQLGAFQPILRLHSDHGDRLPWQYGAGRAAAAQALRLREALVPYTYSLAWQAHRTGMPIVRALYLDYADDPEAYRHPEEYLYGPDVLVAPVTSPGEVATSRVWLPPGRWTDAFTGATYHGGTTVTLRVPLERMPVFVRAGGILAEQPAMAHAGAAPAGPLTLEVHPGADGRFVLHSDAGEGLGYRRGQYAETPIAYREHGGRRHRHATASTLTIGADRGRYPGRLRQRSYAVELVDVSRPDAVTLDHRALRRTTPGGDGPGWWYDATDATLHVRTGSLPTSRTATIAQTGGRAVDRPQSAAVGLTLDPSTPTTLAGGGTATVTATVANAGPGAITGTRVALDAPAGWSVAPVGSATPGTVPEGGTATVSWKVTAPPGGGTAALRATAAYVSAESGAPGSVTVGQGPKANLPPAITSVEPTSAAAGDVVTIHGHDFGDTQDGGYVFFVDGDTSWGAPFDGAEFHVDSWSDDRITFTVPTPSGPGGVWHVTPGTTATVSVTTASGSSGQAAVRITG